MLSFNYLDMQTNILGSLVGKEGEGRSIQHYKPQDKAKFSFLFFLGETQTELINFQCDFLSTLYPGQCPPCLILLWGLHDLQG